MKATRLGVGNRELEGAFNAQPRRSAPLAAIPILGEHIELDVTLFDPRDRVDANFAGKWFPGSVQRVFCAGARGLLASLPVWGLVRVLLERVLPRAHS